MSGSHLSRSNQFRRLALMGSAFVLLLLSCSRDLTGPNGGGSLRLARGLAFETVFPTAPSGAPLTTLVPFTKVHVVFHHSDGTLALDTLVDYPPDSTSITLNISVALLPDAPATGEPLSLTLDYLDANGHVVFHGGPVTVIAAPGVQSTPPVVVPVTYAGPGATAKTVEITPSRLTVFEGAPFAFTGAAKDSVGQLLAATPIVWSLLDSGATLAADTAGRGTAGNKRDSLRVAATLYTGPADTALLIIQPVATRLITAAGDSQTGRVSGMLALPVTVKVVAADSLGVAGVTVAFTAANAGTVDSTGDSTTTVLTDANGLASVPWKLGNGIGAQSLSASVAGLTGSPVTFHATALAGPPVALRFSAQPPDSVASAQLFGVTVEAQDSAGNVATSFTGTVTLAMDSNATSDSLRGTVAVNAVAGVATFSGLSLRKSGFGYTIAASATGLHGAVSSALTVTAGPAVSLNFATQPPDSVKSGEAFAVKIEARDSAGNRATSFAGAITLMLDSSATGDTLRGTAAVNAVAGEATFSGLSLLKADTGYTISAKATDLTGATSARFRVTAGAAAKLKFTTQPPDSLISGERFSAAVTAQDSGGNVVPGFVGTVTLALDSNVAGDSLRGTVAANAVAGVASFSGLSLRKASSGYTISASATGVSSAVSSPVGIWPGPMAACVLVSGGGQTAAEGSTLAPIVLITVDSANNAIAHSQVTASVSAGGTLAADTVVSDANAQAAFTWTLAAMAGTQTLDVKCASQVLPVTATATATSLTRTWTGAVSAAWTADSNWAPLGVPGATDSVIVPADMPHVAKLLAATTVKSLNVLPGAALEVNNDSLTVTGTLAGASVLGDSGTVLLAGSGTVSGNIAPAVVVSGAYSTSAQTTLTGRLTVSGSGALTLNHQRIQLENDLTTQGSGTVVLTNAEDTLDVGGNAHFGGGDETGKLTAGLLRIGKSFTQTTNATAFVGSASFITRFMADSAGISFANPTTSHFGRLELWNSTFATLQSSVATTGDVWIPSTLGLSVRTDSTDSVFVGGALLDSAEGRWLVTTTVMRGANAAMPKNFAGNLVIAASNALTDSLKVHGSLAVSGTGTVLDLNGHGVWITDSLLTTAGGALKMANALDSVWVKGDANFQGGSTAGLLTAGYLEVTGAHFTQGTNSQAYAATSPHMTWFYDDEGGPTSHTLTFANPGFTSSHFGDLYVGDTLTELNSDVYADGALSTGIAINHHVRGSADHLLVSRGANVVGLLWDNVRWQLVDGAPVQQMGATVFENISNTTAPQFEWNRPGTKTAYALSSWHFETPPTGAGVYVKMTSSANADTLDFERNGVLPMLAGGFTQALDGGVVLWPSALTYTGPNYGSWSTTGNWNNGYGVVPDSTTDVIITGPDTVEMDVAVGMTRSLTLNAGSQLVQQEINNLLVYGDLMTDTLSASIACQGEQDSTGVTFQVGGASAAKVQGNFCRYWSERPVTQVGPVNVSNLLYVHDGTFDLNGHRLHTARAWLGTSANATGALKMASANDSLIVDGTLIVGGDLGATPSAGVSTLTAGYMQLSGDVYVYGQTGAGYFNSQPAQMVALTGSERQLSFTDTTSGFGTVTASGSPFTVDSVVRVSGDLHLVNFGYFTGANGRLRVAGNLYGGVNTQLLVGAFELGGVNSDTGTFSPDTAIYTGTNQIILDSLAAGTGKLTYKSIRVAGTATMQTYGASRSSINVSGSLIVSGNGKLTIGNGVPLSVNVSDSLITQGAGTIQMSGPVDSTTLAGFGSTRFAGGDETGKLTGGTLELHGNFAQAGGATSFVADTGMLTRFGGASSAVSFASPLTSHFGRLSFRNAPAVQFQTNVSVLGDIVMPSALQGEVTTFAADTVFASANIVDSIPGFWEPNTTVFLGTNARMPVDMYTNVVVAASNALADSMHVHGSLTVTGATTVLDMNGQRVWVDDSLTTRAGGVLRMAAATDSLWVSGNARFEGGSTSGQLTNGYLEITGASFTQGTNAEAFVATAPHVTRIADPVSEAAIITSHTIAFANPGFSASHFGTLAVDDTSSILESGVYVDGELVTNGEIQRHVKASADELVVSRGANVMNMFFDNVRWQMLDGASFDQAYGIKFADITNSTAPQFEWNRAGTGTTYDLNGWTFLTRPTGAGVYVKMTSSGTPDVLNLGDYGVTPAASGGLLDTLGGGTIIWPDALTYTGSNYGDWNTYGNWNNSYASIPDSTMDVIIPAGDTVSMAAAGTARNLTIASGARVNIGGNGQFGIRVFGNLAGDTLNAALGVAGPGFVEQVNVAGTASVAGGYENYRSERTVKQGGPVLVTDRFNAQDGTYDLNGHTLNARFAYVGGAVGNTGSLIMTHATDSLLVSDSLGVGGDFGASQSAGVSSLTNGVIVVTGGMYAYGAPGAGYFNSHAAQKVTLAGAEKTVGISDSTASGFGTLFISGQRQLVTSIDVAGDLNLVGNANVANPARRLRVGGNLYGGASSQLSGMAFELAGANVDSGFFHPDTAIFTGTNQVIQDSLAAGYGNYAYNSIRVTGSAIMRPYAATSDSIGLSGDLIVSDGGSLVIGNGTPLRVTVYDSLVTRSGGILNMSGDPSITSLEIHGNALFDGGNESGQLTGGTLLLQSNFAQTSSSSALSFAPSGAQTTVFADGQTQAVTFATPGTGAAGSHFASLALGNSDGRALVSLGSPIFVDDSLTVPANAYGSASISGNAYTVTAAGVSVPLSSTGPNRLVFNNAPFRFVDGTSAATLTYLQFTGFGSAVAFEDARSDAITLNYPAWVGTPLSGNFLLKSGTGATVTLNAPSPVGTLWTLGVYYAITGSGTLVIPPS